jgi:hypothetical protein
MGSLVHQRWIETNLYEHRYTYIVVNESPYKCGYHWCHVFSKWYNVMMDVPFISIGVANSLDALRVALRDAGLSPVGSAAPSFSDTRTELVSSDGRLTPALGLLSLLSMVPPMVVGIRDAI